MEAEDTRARLAAVGAEVETTAAEVFSRIVREEIRRWAKVVKTSGASAN